MIRNTALSSAMLAQFTGSLYDVTRRSWVWRHCLLPLKSRSNWRDILDQLLLLLLLSVAIVSVRPTDD